MKWYGNVANRIEENRGFNQEIKVGMDVTRYDWSDRHAYYITRVESQKRFFMKEYEVIADREKANGMGHQNWLYFKTRKECHEYLNKHLKPCPKFNFETEPYPTEGLQENPEEEIVFRYGHWYKKYTDYFGQVKYSKINISLGVRDYYYDWEF